ncbi:hypothetical protein FB45DRAFT_943057 [Roridomyces roridus]|uniref:Mid2 domain-containing protein n=1 Tax=Roridomyces roridus TaxID=1738132 RepID=A0AAD7B3V0_9AGAR|nr:hypothetical protein FB45DRAFT_943057 [Roridomyces roridus]
MLFFLYVLAFLCSAVFSVKIHIHGDDKLVAHRPFNVSWERQHHSDPKHVQIVMQNVTGGDKFLANTTDGSKMQTSVSLPPGTFRMWAVNPKNESELYAMSENFTVLADTEDGLDSDASSLTATPLSTVTSAADLSPTAPADSDHHHHHDHSDDSSSTSSLPPAAIAGIIIGGVTLLFLLCALAYIIHRRRDARVTRRITFYRERMVRSLRLSFRAQRDPEAGAGTASEKPPSFAESVISTPSTHSSRFRENLSPALMAPYPFAPRTGL